MQKKLKEMICRQFMFIISFSVTQLNNYFTQHVVQVEFLKVAIQWYKFYGI